jgi:hypothetical protein
MTVVTLKREAFYSDVTITVPLPLRRRLDEIIRRSPLSENEVLLTALEAGLDLVPDVSILGNSNPNEAA